MHDPDAPPVPRTRWDTAALLLLFVGSGCSALIYELVWFHLLQLVIGASAVSLAALLVSFMGGMGLGSLLLPVLVSADRHPLRVYAAVELGIAACGLALPLALPYVQIGYLTFAGYGLTGILVRGAVCTLCLLPPTILMGATLPAIARWTRTTRAGVSKLGLFYGGNIAGAVLGTLLASFYLLRVYDTLIATAVAVTINVVVALIATHLARRRPHTATGSPESTGAPASATRFVLVTIGLSGLTALGAEVVWTRQLSLLFGATVYAFSLILAVFLSGLGLGGLAGARLASRLARPGLALGGCQLAIAAAIPYAATMIVAHIPHWEAPEPLWGVGPVATRFLFDMFRCAVAMLPATLLWGLSFPLAIATAALDRTEPGRVAGWISATNTFGALAGALLFGLLAIPWLGSEGAQQALAALAVMSAGIIGWHELSATPPEAPFAEARATGPSVLLTTGMAALLAGTPLLAARFVPATPGALVAYGRQIQQWNAADRFLYLEEGVNASVAVTEGAEDVHQIHISGKVVASNHDFDMRIERMLGHLPALLHPQPRSVLIVGFGAGVTAGSFVVHPEVERIVICEIEPRVVDGGGTYFTAENHAVLEDPRTEVVFDDARHFLATTEETFDIITSDPIHPWVRGAATLYSVEYYDLVKRHLNPGGIVTQWVPMYETSEAAVKTEIATFAQAFPHTTLWSSDLFELGYDLVLLGRPQSTPIDAAQIDARLADNRALRTSLEEVMLGSSGDLLWTFAGRSRDLADWLQDADINRERSLRLQYLAGLALDIKGAYGIYQSILDHRRYPAGLFRVSRDLEAELRQAFEGR